MFVAACLSNCNQALHSFSLSRTQPSQVHPAHQVSVLQSLVSLLSHAVTHLEKTQHMHPNKKRVFTDTISKIFDGFSQFISFVGIASQVYF